MHHFTDNKGETWGVELTLGLARKVDRATQVYLPDLFADDLQLYARMCDDLGLLVDVAFELCREQASERGVDAEGFACRMGGDTLLGVRKAIEEEVIDFFPEPRRREKLRRILAQLERAAGVYMDRTAEADLATLETMSEADIARLLSGSPAKPPAS